MKKLLLYLVSLAVVACSTPVQQSTVPMDMKTVYEYQQRVATGKTVDSNAKADDEPLNQSDRRSQENYHSTILQPILYPSIDTRFNRHRHRYDW